MKYGKKTRVNPHQHNSSIKVDAKKTFQLWADEKKDENALRWRENNEKRIRFVSKYSCDVIDKLTLEEYCKGSDSFCRLIRVDLNGLASMGNAYPATFGIYIKKDTEQICLSKTFENKFGDDTDAAFRFIKKEIINCIKGFRTEGFDVVNSVKLNRMFLYKLLLIYYPDDMYPVCSKGTLKKYCDYFGISYSEDEEMYVGIQRILDWKNKSSLLRKINNAYLMYFGGWLITTDQSIDYNELIDSEEQENDINIPCTPSEILIEGDKVKYICGHCGYSFVKTTRCPECGQLVKE